MRCFLLAICLCISTCLHCNQGTEKLSSIPLADTETEASAIVGGCINVITGSYIAPHNDWSLPSAEPLSLTRTYSHKKYFPSGLHLCWRHNYHSEALFATAPRTVNRVKEHASQTDFVASNGSATIYQHQSKKEEDNFLMPFAPVTNNYYGLTNTGSGVITGQTNLKNNTCEFTRKKKSKSDLKITTGSGHYYLMQQDKHKVYEGDTRFTGKESFHYRMTAMVT